MQESTILPQRGVTIVGVLNITPDSFSDGGRFVAPRLPGERVDVEAICRSARGLVAEGADWVDVGGESTRPGARPVAEELERARVVPVVEALAKELAAPISVDTRKASVAREALAAGARIVNDVSGGRHDPAILEVAARFGAGLVLGHLRGEPATMQHQIHFDDVVAEVAEELAAAADAAQRAGVARGRLVVDPGIGFGKELRHNLELLAGVGRLRARVGLPVMVGPSRKSFLARLEGETEAGAAAPRERDLETHVACAIAIFGGADAVRVHDVAGARRARGVAQALRAARASGEGGA